MAFPPDHLFHGKNVVVVIVVHRKTSISVSEPKFAHFDGEVLFRSNIYIYIYYFVSLFSFSFSPSPLPPSISQLAIESLSLWWTIILEEWVEENQMEKQQQQQQPTTVRYEHEHFIVVFRSTVQFRQQEKK